MPTSPSLTTPQFIETNVGLAAASVATPVGPFVHITGFRIGSAYNYTPQPTDTDLNGDLVYQGVPDSYEYVGDNTINIICRIPAAAGPFLFGEVCVDLVGPVMFAKAAFDTQQVKYTSLGTNVLSTYTFNCLLKLQQPVAIFKVDTLFDLPDIWTVDLWSDVYPPALQANPNLRGILVKELDINGNSTLITPASDTHWSPCGNYRLVKIGTVVGSTTSSIDFAMTELVNVEPGVVAKEYVIETQDGYLRACTSEVIVGANMRFNLTEPLPVAPPAGSKVSLFSMYTNQTKVILSGSLSGSGIIKGDSTTINVSLDLGAIAARSVSYKTAGTYSFPVPTGVSFLYIDAGGGGGGGSGAGGGWNVNHVTNQEYRAGGGGGGGGVPQTVSDFVLAVNPGDIIDVVVGAKGLGGIGGTAPGGNGGAGTDGGATIIKKNGVVVLTLAGGLGAMGGAGFGPPSNSTGAGAGGGPGGSAGTDGYFGGGGGAGASSEFGTGGGSGRGATANPAGGAPGGDAQGNSSGGGGGGGIYLNTATDNGGPGGNGSDGIFNARW